MAETATTKASLSPQETWAEAVRIKKALLREEKKFLEEQERIAPHLAFVPHGGQEKFLKLLDGCPASGINVFGAFCGQGWGKSFLLVNIIWAIVGRPESRNTWFNQPIFARWPFPKHIRIVCPSIDVKEPNGEIYKAIQRWWPAGHYKPLKQGYDYYASYEIPATGFIVDVRTFDQPSEAHRSSTIGAVLFNEPPPYGVYVEYPGRFRHGGIIAFFATLAEHSEWVQSEIIENPSCKYMFGDIEENCVSHSVRGTLQHDNVEAMIARYPAHEREARRTGRPIHLRGRALNFDEAVHVVPRSKLPTERFSTSYLVLDPHQRRPWAILIGQIDRLGDFYIVDEWPRIDTPPWNSPYHKIISSTLGLDAYAGIIRDLKSKWKVNQSIIDSKFAAQLQSRDDFAVSLRDDLAVRFGLHFVAGNPHVRGSEGGLNRVKELLGYDMSKPVDFTNKPRLFVAENCWNTRYQMLNLRHKESADVERVGQTETLDEQFLDFPRNVMYLAMHQCRYQPQEDRRIERSEADLAIENKVLTRLNLPHNEYEPVQYEEPANA